VPDDPDAPVRSVLLRRILRGLCALWYKIIGGYFQPAGAFAFWSVALGAIPAIWDVILGFIAPNMDLNTVNG
jgi:hypothetical protein